VMVDESLHSPHTAHTLNPVPFVIFNGPQGTLRAGKLCDIAPTILQLLNLPQPPSITGEPLMEMKNV
jgi:2,3-bisphosphoglycerate-independent phosphoglycerate mutase